MLKFSRILVVDDLLDNLVLLQTFLELEGYQVDTADCGKLAIAKIEDSPPDLILMDVMMPDMTGYEVARQIRQDLCLLDIPIFLVSAYEDFAIGNSADFKVTAFLRKPVDFDRLLASIRGIG